MLGVEIFDDIGLVGIGPFTVSYRLPSDNAVNPT